MEMRAVSRPRAVDYDVVTHEEPMQGDARNDRNRCVKINTLITSTECFK